MRLRPGPDALWFVRHGQSEGNVLADQAALEGRQHVELPTRDADTPLSELGAQQSRALGQWLAEQPARLRPTYVITSPYLRARETARLVLEAIGGDVSQRAPEVDERCRDREMGVIENLTWAGVTSRLPDEAKRGERVGHFYYRPPGGESWADICLRLRTLLGDAARDLLGERVLFVAHDAVVQLARALIDGLDEGATVELLNSTTYANCALTTYEADGDGYRLTAWNRTVPLEEEGAPVTEEPDAATVD